MFSNPQKIIEEFGLSEGARVADLGSGSGFYALAAAKRVGERGRVFAVDAQKEMLQKLKNEARRLRLHNIETFWGDIEKLGGTRLADQAVDACLIANTLFFVEHKENFLAEVKRILKPGGQALLVDWKDSFGGMGPAPEHVIGAAEARTLFEKAGFSFERDVSAGAHHYGFIFRR